MSNLLYLIKKYLGLTIGLALALVLLAAVGSRLFFVIKKHHKETQELNGAKARLDELNQRPTFPSAANIARENAKLADLTDEYNELNSLLAAEQVLPEEMEGAEFMTFFEKTSRSIRERLQAGRVTFPQKYAFGFEKYAGGMLPAARDIPRLVQQLKITGIICEILPDAAVNELISFSREEFEVAADKSQPPPGRGRAAPSAPGAGSAPARPDGQIYSSQHFKMSFKAQEGSLLDLLNRFARLPMFTVVARVEITNPRREVNVNAAGQDQPAAAGNAPKSAAVAKAQQGEELSRDKRIILGREEVTVSLEMDVYNFGPQIPWK